MLNLCILCSYFETQTFFEVISPEDVGSKLSLLYFEITQNHLTEIKLRDYCLVIIMEENLTQTGFYESRNAQLKAHLCEVNKLISVRVCGLMLNGGNK